MSGADDKAADATGAEEARQEADDERQARAEAERRIRARNAPLAALSEEERAAATRRGRTLFSRPPRFLMGVTSMNQLPEPFEAEIAFAGRSNVGKSSLINALFNCKDVARTSNTPGRTRELNYFTLADGRMALVDMPGYGYAKASKSLVKRWQALVRDYLRGRPMLRRVFILVDARHGLKPQDLEAMKLLDETAVNYQIVLTKADKARKDALEKLVRSISRELARHPAAHPEVHITSARKKTGLDELRATIAQLLPDENGQENGQDQGA